MTTSLSGAAPSTNSFAFMNPTVGSVATHNPYQPSASSVSDINAPGSTNHGICSLTFQDRVFRFRTNPNEIWWTYELITNVEQTYGGRVVQILGTRLGDLSVKVECGKGGWPYLMSVVTYLRDVISDQRNGNTATFEYTTRNWKLGVYAMNVPFQDQVTAVNRELTLTFKIQEDVSGMITTATLNSELSKLQEGIYRQDQNVHNQYNDSNAGGTPLDQFNVGGPGNYNPIGQPNPVLTQPQGANPGGLNPIAGIPFLPSIPGLGGILGGL